jgi:hypothetical protein
MCIVCVDNNGVYLTVGKTYEIVKIEGDYVTVINDIGTVSGYSFNCHFKFNF